MNPIDPELARQIVMWAAARQRAGKSPNETEALIRQKHPFGLAEARAAYEHAPDTAHPASIGRDEARAAGTAAQGVLGNFGDELVGGMAAAGTPGIGTLPIDPAQVDRVYRGARDRTRSELDAFRAEHPVAAPALEMAGAAAGPGELLGAATKTMAPAERGLAAVVGGAGIGATYGAGNAPEMTDVLGAAGSGAGVGALAGTGGAAASSFLEEALPELVGLVAPTRMGRIISARRLRAAAHAADLTPAAADARMGALETGVGPGIAAPVDLTEQNVGRGATAVRSGAGNIDQIKSDVLRRVTGQPGPVDAGTGGSVGRLSAWLRSLGGANQFADEAVLGRRGATGARLEQGTAQTLLDRVGAKYRPFEDATAGGVEVTPAMTKFLRRPDVIDRWEKVNPVGADRASAEQALTAAYTDRGSAAARLDPAGYTAQVAQRVKGMLEQRGFGPPTLRHFQALAQSFRDDAIRATNAGDAGAARDARTLLGELNTHLEATPGLEGLGAVNREYAQASSVQDAFDQGGKIRWSDTEGIRHGMRQAAEAAGPYATDAIDAYRQGALQKALTELLGSGRTANVGQSFASLSRDLFPTQRAATAWLNSAQGEQAIWRTYNAVSGGSRTSADLLSARMNDVKGGLTRFLMNATRVQREAARSTIKTLFTPGAENYTAYRGMIAPQAPSSAFGAAAASAGAASEPDVRRAFGALVPWLNRPQLPPDPTQP